MEPEDASAVPADTKPTNEPSPPVADAVAEAKPAASVAAAPTSATALAVAPAPVQQQVPTTKPPSSSEKDGKQVASLEQANEEIALLLQGGKVTMQEVNALQHMMREHVALREKVGKLKSLLGRSAKAQRETKMELDGTNKRLEQALREVERLQSKVERLANRPTHMELLADFETNFDRALLSVGQQQQQAGGQESGSAASPAAPVSAPTTIVMQQQQQEAPPVVDGMLMQELSESKNRIERLESLNAALVHRSSQLEQDVKEAAQERDSLQQKLTHAQLELRMAKMEAEHAARALQDKAASLEEMQLEIDLVTKASVDAQKRAQKGEQAAKSVLTDRQHVINLEHQVAALQEWAQASAQAKRLACERVQILERQLKIFQGQQNDPTGQSGERSLFRQANSLVIGAGDVGFTVVEMEGVSLQTHERVLLKWKFDITPSDMGVEYSMLKGKCDTSDKQRQADYIIKDRHVTGGAGGETEHAFSVQSACTLLFSNKSSWVRPRTIKYEVQAVAIVD